MFSPAPPRTATHIAPEFRAMLMTVRAALLMAAAAIDLYLGIANKH